MTDQTRAHAQGATTHGPFHHVTQEERDTCLVCHKQAQGIAQQPKGRDWRESEPIFPEPPQVAPPAGGDALVGELADVAEAAFIPEIKRLRAALEDAAGRFNMMAGVGLVNGIDPKVGYREAMAALSLTQAASEHAQCGAGSHVLMPRDPSQQIIDRMTASISVADIPTQDDPPDRDYDYDMRKAYRAALAAAEAGYSTPAASEVERLKDANDYHDHHPLTGFRKPAASEGPFNAEMPSSLNDACRRLDLAQERISQLEAQVEEASGLIHDLLGLELGSSERAMAWLDSRSDTSTESRVEQTRDLPRESKFEMQTNLCSDCPPTGYGTDVTRCTQCPRATSHPSTMCTCGGDPGQPASDHDISCPAALSTTPHVSKPEVKS